MKTIIFIHGGESFGTHKEYIDWIQTTAVLWNTTPFEITETKKRWKLEIAQQITEQGSLVYLPEFPNPQNAKYDEWKLFFDAWISQIQLPWDIIFVGTSLGGCFLLKYFSEQNLSWKMEHGLLRIREWQALNIATIHLIAACIEAGDFTAPSNYVMLNSLGNRVHIWHAEDDSVVPFETAKTLERILPEAQTHFFTSEKWYGHFHGIEHIPELEKILLP